MIRCMLGLIALMLLAGCGSSEDREPHAKNRVKEEVRRAEEKKEEQSSVGMAFDGLTGKTQLEAKRNSEKKIRKIASEHNQKLEDLMDE